MFWLGFICLLVTDSSFPYKRAILCTALSGYQCASATFSMYLSIATLHNTSVNMSIPQEESTQNSPISARTINNFGIAGILGGHNVYLLHVTINQIIIFRSNDRGHSMWFFMTLYFSLKCRGWEQSVTDHFQRFSQRPGQVPLSALQFTWINQPGLPAHIWRYKTWLPNIMCRKW